MRKTKLSVDLFAQQHGNDGLFARFYQHPGSARSQRRPSPRLAASASHHLPLYQDKAVTPTPLNLKDIFTPIWAGPYPLVLYDRRIEGQEHAAEILANRILELCIEAGGSIDCAADGTLASSGGKVVKNVAGYDLPKLATGALGTLGVITRANFR